MYTIGIHDGHNASVAVLRGCDLVGVFQEERFVKEKNYDGFPEKALSYVLDDIVLDRNEVEHVVLNGKYQPKPLQRLDRLKSYDAMFSKGYYFRERLKRLGLVRGLLYSSNQNVRSAELDRYGLQQSVTSFCDHHMAHAYSAIYGAGELEKDKLVFTNDGSGDGECATISVYRAGRIEKMCSVSDRNSVGLLYAIFTYLLGMVPLEHEYKIMGMAPYADSRGARKVADQLHSLFEFSSSGLTWKYTGGFSVTSSIGMLTDRFRLTRFDHMMGGLQVFIEEHMRKWILSAVESTGIGDIVCSGGTFMNVKANKVVMEIDSVESMFVFPSCGDESNSIGAAYSAVHGREIECVPKALLSVYFGREYSNAEVEDRYRNYPFKNNYTITKYADVEREVAALLSEGHVVARFQGREEFGARSLGNRAILANPKSRDVVKEINAMIKQRDFWMPFACSILDEDYDKYIVGNDKGVPYFMIMTYETTDMREEIAAGIHPYDHTVRPQYVSKDTNDRYHCLLSYLKSEIGVGAVLNTSLNLHGLPLVHEPEDAFHVMEMSSLRYLAIEDYIVEKKR